MKIVIFISSIILVLLFSLIPDLSNRLEEDGTRVFGFPADWLALYPNGGFSFLGWGFLFNIGFFYLICLFVFKYFKQK